MAPLDFSGYMSGIVNNGPGYRPPTVIEICQALELKIKLLKKQIGEFTSEDYESFKQTIESALESLNVLIEGVSNNIEAITGNIASLTDDIVDINNVLPDKEDKSNKTGTIDSGSTSAQYPTAEAVYNALLALFQDIEERLRTKANGYTNGAAKLSVAIPYGECDDTSTATAFTATVPGITELKDGVAVLLKNGIVTSAANFTININGLGAKPSYSNMSTGNDITPTAPTRDSTIFNINYTMLCIYSETIVSGGGWIMYRGYDANSNTIGYQIRTNSQRLKMTDQMYRYRLMFTGVAEDTLVPANSSTSTNATSARTPITRPINPHGPIYYYGYSSAVSAGSRPSAAYYWQQYVVTLGYSFTASALTQYKSLYLVCSPQADGNAIIDATTPYTQNLPTAADGKIYIFLGVAISETQFELNLSHPIYYHDGTALRLWTGPVI